MKKLVLFACLLALACMVFGADQPAKAGMSEKSVSELLDKVLEMWNKPNLELIPELYTADCQAFTSSAPAPYAGHEGIRMWIEANRAMMPDMLMTFSEVVTQGDKTATVWTITGTQTGPMLLPGGTLPATGRKVSITGLAIDYMKDGKFAKEVVIFNLLDMLMQLGFTLQPPQPPPAQ